MLLSKATGNLCKDFQVWVLPFSFLQKEDFFSEESREDPLTPRKVRTIMDTDNVIDNLKY